MGDRTPAVRNRHAWARTGSSKQAIILILLIALAFGTAIYLGVRNPYPLPEQHAGLLRSTVVPLAPRGPVPGAEPAELFRHSRAAEFRIGAEGVNLPAARATENFSDGQVLSALTTAKDYIVRSALDPDVLTGGAVRSVRLLLDPDQLAQFDRSLERPVDDGQHAATGWLIRFDPGQVALADPGVRVQGTLAVSETGPDQLEVTGDHIFVYAVHPAGAGEEGKDRASLFTVRREVRLRFDHGALRDHRLQVQQTYLQAGPLSCASDAAGRLRPLLAGQSAASDGRAGTDPFAAGRPTASLCGVLSRNAQPSLPSP